MTTPDLKAIADIRQSFHAAPVMQDISETDRMNLAVSRITARTLIAVLNHYRFEIVHKDSSERLMYHEIAFVCEEINEMIAAARKGQ